MSCTGLNVCLLQPIQMKVILFFKVRVPVLDTRLYTVLMFLYSPVAYLLMPIQSKNVSKRMEAAVLYHSHIVLPIYNPPSLPSELDRKN